MMTHHFFLFEKKLSPNNFRIWWLINFPQDTSDPTTYPINNPSFKYFCHNISSSKKDVQILEEAKDSIYPEISPGGEFKPKNAKSSAAIIIPYRNRQSQLLHFLNLMPKILMSQNLHFKIYVVNQVDDFKFNRGALLNVGYNFAR